MNEITKKTDSLTERELEFLRYVYLGYSRDLIEEILKMDDEAMDSFCKEIDFKMQHFKKEDIESDPFLMSLVA